MLKEYLDESIIRELQEFGSTNQDIQLIVSSFYLAPYDENMGVNWIVTLEPWGNHLHAANLSGRTSHDTLYKHSFLFNTLYSAIENCKSLGWGVDVQLP